MKKVCIHIGLSLFAIKRMCETTDNCNECPLRAFCGESNFFIADPCCWDEKLLPDAGLMLDLTDAKEK